MAAKLSLARDPSRIPWYLPLGTVAVYLLWRGYGYGDGDQDVFLPYLLHLLDPTVFASDWFVQAQLEAFGPRTGFVWLTYLPAKVLGPFATFALLWILSWYAITAAIYVLSYVVKPDPVAATGAVIALMLVLPRVSLGSNDLMLWQFVPSVAGWALALWGIVAHLKGRPVVAACLLGLTAWVQALVGLQMALVVGLLMVWERQSLRSVLLYGVAFTLVAGGAILPQVLQQWQASATDPSFYHILFEFRAPHHYLPTKFATKNALAFLGLTAMGLVGLRWLKPPERSFPLRVLVIIGALCLVAFVGTEVLQSEFVGKLQLFRATVFAKVVLAIIVCAAISQMLPSGLGRRLAAALALHRTLLLMAVLAVAVALATSVTRLGFAPQQVTTSDTPESQIAAWARTMAPDTSVFAVPPSWDGFRVQSQRAIVVNFKSIPFTAPTAHQWYERLMHTAPLESTSAWSSSRVVPALDSAFYALSPSAAMALCERYSADYLVRADTLRSPPAGFEPVHTAGGLVVYRVDAP